MKKLFAVVSAALIAISCGALADEQAQGTKVSSGSKKPSVTKERIVNATATVEAIDLAKRVVTLKGPKGNLFDITAGDEVRNLAQVKVGDLVKVK